ncbi:PWWP domain-containing protein 3-like [Phragmites australis]|uniref:PWWP domain-containing protein 3-like n=1 Tax=Phragmites australis TaxID=29695 RepID=UPI002D7952A5|nr:PWWP domain-containing protein 3-like [Phragmites australis]
MRAITGAVASSKSCSLAKAARVLALFSDSDLPSSDAGTYLRAAAAAATHHHLFRRDLRANHQQGTATINAYEGQEGEKKLQDGEVNGGVADLAGGSHDSAAEVAVDNGEKKSKKKKKEERREDGAVAGFAAQGPVSPEIAREKRKKKKEKHSKKDQELSDVKLEAGFVAEELGSEKKVRKKNEKDHVKLEEDLGHVKEEKGQITNDGVSEQGIPSGEKKRKKKRHTEEEGNSRDVNMEDKMVTDGDLDSVKKRKKKRGRGADDDNVLEQVEHTKKKQRKQS